MKSQRQKARREQARLRRAQGQGEVQDDSSSDLELPVLEMPTPEKVSRRIGNDTKHCCNVHCNEAIACKSRWCQEHRRIWDRLVRDVKHDIVDVNSQKSIIAYLRKQPKLTTQILAWMDVAKAQGHKPRQPLDCKALLTMKYFEKVDEDGCVFQDAHEFEEALQLSPAAIVHMHNGPDLL